MNKAQPPNPAPTSVPIAAGDVPGHVLGFTDLTGRGVYATRPFLRGETVVRGSNGEVKHSSDPNCELGQSHAGAVELVARLDIEAGSELTVDHARSARTAQRPGGSDEPGPSPRNQRVPRRASTSSAR